MATGSQSRRKRRFDPGRRERIALAAYEVILKHGLNGLTHRRTAAAADVPLGSITYHFEGDDLLEAALDHAVRDGKAYMEEWADSLGANPDVPARLTEIIVLAAGPERIISIAGFQLYVAAAEVPQLRQLSVRRANILSDVLLRFTDELTAISMAVAFDSLMLRALVDDGFKRETVEAVFRRIWTT